MTAAATDELEACKYRVHPSVLPHRKASAGHYAFRPSSGGAF
jgi:hypothetical protein